MMDGKLVSVIHECGHILSQDFSNHMVQMVTHQICHTCDMHRDALASERCRSDWKALAR